MTTRVQWDFSKMAALEHIITATGTFTGVAERGRAKALLGSSNAKTRLAATRLGDEMNDRSYTVRAAGGSMTTVTADSNGVQVQPASGATANDVIAAINAFSPFPAFRFTTPPPEVRADANDGTGASAVGTGSTTFAGGAVPTELSKGHYSFSDTSDAGLFVFDHDGPLELVQMGMRLSGSVAWALTLRPLTAARGDRGTPYSIASGTGQNYLLSNGTMIPPGWGLGFEANAQGTVWVIVRSPR